MCCQKALIEETGEEWLKQFLIEEFGGWPLINQTNNLSDNYLDQMLRFHRNNMQPIFKVGIIHNPDKHEYNILKVSLIRC